MNPTLDSNMKERARLLTSEFGTPTTNSSGVVERTRLDCREKTGHIENLPPFYPPEFLIIVSNHPILTIRPLVPSEKRTSSPYIKKVDGEYYRSTVQQWRVIEMMEAWYAYLEHFI